VIGGPILSLGKATTLVGESADSVVGRYELPFTNEINGVLYQYMRMYTTSAARRRRSTTRLHRPAAADECRNPRRTRAW
jgi:hypothetical protein